LNNFIDYLFSQSISVRIESPSANINNRKGVPDKPEEPTRASSGKGKDVTKNEEKDKDKTDRKVADKPMLATK